MNADEKQARAIIGDWLFERIVRVEDRAHAIRAAEVRLYAEQHQARAFWKLAKAVAK
jgi:DnaJ-domain-containing protein 1